MLHGLADLLAHIAPEAIAVVIVRIVFRLITHAIDDEERWRRVMSVLAPPLALILTLVVMAAWWLVGDGGLQLILHGLGPPTATPDEPTDMTTPA